jgi:hypothetical protein
VDDAPVADDAAAQRKAKIAAAVAKAKAKKLAQQTNDSAESNKTEE